MRIKVFSLAGFPVNESSDDPRSADDYIEVRFRSLTELNDNMERVSIINK